jgi:peptide/nickel transport system substrate-binding protein
MHRNGEPDDDRGALSMLSRRRFLAGLGAVTAGAATLPILDACGANTGSTSTAWAKAPVTFVFAADGDADHIDPALVSDFESFQVTRNCYDPLVQVDDAHLKLVPWLATSWETSADGTTTTLHLRDGVMFSDGSKFDAAAAKLNLDRVMALQQGPYYVISNFKSVSVVDPMTIAITTQTPDTYVAAHLVKVGMVSAQAVNDHKTASDPWATQFFQSNVVGCGPYKMQSWQKGSQITLVKNDKWWKGWQPGSIDRVIIKPMDDTASRVELVQSGGADFTDLWPIADALRVGRSKGFTLIEANTFDTDPVFYMNTQKPPFNNLQLRQAAQYAFDYKSMISYYKGNATIPTGPMPADFTGGSKDLKPFAQDLDKARSLLKQSGVDPSKINVNFLLSAGSEDFSVGATVMQASLKKLGIGVSINQVPTTELLSRYANAQTSGDMTDIIQSPFTLDPSLFMSFYLPGNTFNLAMFNDPYVTSNLQKVGTLTDKNQRDTLLNTLQHYIRDKAPCVWGARPKTLVPVPDHVTGYVMQATDYRWTMRFDMLRIRAH